MAGTITIRDEFCPFDGTIGPVTTFDYSNCSEEVAIEAAKNLLIGKAPNTRKQRGKKKEIESLQLIN